MKLRSLPITLAILALFAASCMYAAGVQPVRVEGTAMLPALNDGDRILLDRRFEKLQRGDIVIFYFPLDQSRSYIKRIIGLPGETVEIRDGQVFIDGNAIQEPYVDSKYNQSARSLTAIKLSPDNYFVMGDNRDNSSDSRIWGSVQKELIYGKYTGKYYSVQ